MTTYPLQGVTVVDLSQIYNGSYATYLLAVNGAKVIKIEPPEGEPLRRRAEAGGGAELPFAMLNGCKQSIVLNLKKEEGKQALRDLVKDADVLVENFAPGVLDRLGVGAEALSQINPRMIYASSSGYGRDGPYKNYTAMDLTIQAMCGIMHTTGFPTSPPVKAGPAVADFFAGIHLYGGILTALFERERTGCARRVEVTMQDSVYASLSSNLGSELAPRSGGLGPSRTGNRHGGLAECPYNVYPTRDGYIAIICVSETHWKNLTGLMDRPDLASDERFATLKGRVDHMDLIDGVVGEWSSGQSTSSLFTMLMEGHVPCAPVRTLSEVINDENMHSRGSLEWIIHPELGRIPVQQSPFRFDGVPPIDLTPSRQLGKDNGEILGTRLGMSQDDIDQATTR